MGIFSSIRNTIFGTSDDTPPPATGSATTKVVAAKTIDPLDEVDVENFLNKKRAAKGQDLHWETSIVDLMKLLDMDSSLQSRKDLAAELGYDGPLDGSADMNTRLHKALMRALSITGGKVPAQFMD